MKWKSTKTPTLDGYDLDVTLSDGSLKEIVFIGADKKPALRVALDSYCMAVGIPEPPTMVKKFALVGRFVGLDVSETFDSRYQADARKNELEGVARSSSDLEVTEVEVELAA